MEVEFTDKICNIVLVGATGSGKSTTANMLYGGRPDEPFLVGNEEISCTFLADQHISKDKKLRVVDTPGFGDNRFHEKQVDAIIKDLTLMLTDPTVESSGVINAFLLPVKFNPRPQTLKSDLEHFIDLFGTVALKTLIILPIYLDDKPRTESDVLKAWSQMTDIMKTLKEGKGTELNANWFCLWDNLKPKPNQEKNLFKKMGAVEPYTHKKFIEAAEETKRRLEARVQKEVDRQLDLIRKKFANDKAEMQTQMREIQQKAEEEKKELLEARQRAQIEVTNLAKALEQMNQSKKSEMAKLYQQMADEKERSRRLVKEIDIQNQKQIEALNKSFSEQTAAFNAQIMALAQRQPESSGGGCFISSTAILLTNNKSVQIEDVRPGDEVVTKDRGTAVQSEELVKWRFPEDTLIYGLNDQDPFFSGGHLFWTTEGWKAIEPEIAQQENPERNIAGKLAIGDVVFRMKEVEEGSIYDLITIQKITHKRLGKNNYLYGLHLLDGHRSYHANGFLVAMNYPVFTFLRFKQGLDRLSTADKKKLMGILDEAGPLLDVVLGPFISRAFDNIEK